MSVCAAMRQNAYSVLWLRCESFFLREGTSLIQESNNKKNQISLWQELQVLTYPKTKEVL